jgi:hypothetical protein
MRTHIIGGPGSGKTTLARENGGFVRALDHMNWERGIWRITRRLVKSAIHEVKKRRGLGRFTRFPDYARDLKQLIQVFFSSRAYYARYPSQSTGRIESRLTTAAFVKPYKDKVILCYNDESVEAFIDYIHLCHEQRG